MAMKSVKKDSFLGLHTAMQEYNITLRLRQSRSLGVSFATVKF